MKKNKKIRRTKQLSLVIQVGFFFWERINKEDKKQNEKAINVVIISNFFKLSWQALRSVYNIHCGLAFEKISKN